MAATTGGRATGLGGVFLKCPDPEATRAWYARALGIEISPWGAGEFVNAAGSRGVWSVFKADTDHFRPSTRDLMLNFPVDDFDALLARLAREGVPLEGEPLEESYGRFCRVMDPDGIRVELWQAKDAPGAAQ